MPGWSFRSWSIEERRSFAVFMIVCVTGMLLYIAVGIYRRVELQETLLAEIHNVASSGLQAAQFDSGIEPKRRQLCFLETDPGALRFLAEKLSQAIAKDQSGRTLVVMEFTVTFSMPKSQQQRFDAEVYSKAPEDVFFFRSYRDGGTSVTPKTPESFALRIPGLASWISRKFREHGCNPR